MVDSSDGWERARNEGLAGSSIREVAIGVPIDRSRSFSPSLGLLGSVFVVFGEKPSQAVADWNQGSDGDWQPRCRLYMPVTRLPVKGSDEMRETGRTHGAHLARSPPGLSTAMPIPKHSSIRQRRVGFGGGKRYETSTHSNFSISSSRSTRDHITRLACPSILRGKIPCSLASRRKVLEEIPPR